MTLARFAHLATAVPPHVLHQQQIVAAITDHYADRISGIARYLPIFANAAIDTRFSCVPLDWYRHEHSFPERNDLYLEHALRLLEEVARRILAAADLDPQEIDGLMVVSTTGIATPSLDGHLVSRLGLRADVTRTPLFGLGCAGGVTGLARTAQLAAARPGSLHLLLIVELCTLSFQADDLSPGNIVSAALFGDGAAGALVGTAVAGPAVLGYGEYTWPETLDLMGWDLRPNGFGVILSPQIPAVVRTRFRDVAHRYLAGQGLAPADLAAFVSHPGGVKVLDALEEVFGLEPGGLAAARQVLRRFGNMSAPTVWFILERELAPEGRRGTMLMSALGPGFTASFVHIEVDGA